MANDSSSGHGNDTPSNSDPGNSGTAADPGQDVDPIERLRNADPARLAPPPDTKVIRAKAFARAHTGAKPYWTRSRPAMAGALASALALTALGGVALGRTTAPAEPAVSAATGSTATAAKGSIASTQGDANAVDVGVPVAPPVLGAPHSEGAMSGTSVAVDAGMMPYYSAGPVTLVPSQSLPDETSSASGYFFDSSSLNLKQYVVDIAKVFNVQGQPVEQDMSGWSVGSGDGSGPYVWLSNDPAASWSFSNPTVNPWACEVAVEPMPKPASQSTVSAPGGLADGSPGSTTSSDSGSGRASEPFVPETCQLQNSPMSGEKATARAREILKELGVGASQAVSDLKWEVQEDGYTTQVTAWQYLGDFRTNYSWNFSFTDKDIVWAGGFGASLRKVDNYPIVGARTALVRSLDPKYAWLGPVPVYDYGVVPMPVASAREPAVAANGSPASSDTVPSRPGRVQAWWDPVTAVSAQLVLTQHIEPNGNVLFLPAYRFQTEGDRGQWTVIAVNESVIDFVPQPSWN